MAGVEDIENNDDDNSDNDEAKLCMISSFLNCQYTETNIRPPVEGVGRTYLCLFRADPFY